MMSLVFIGTPEFAIPSLRSLHSAGHTISAVVTQPDRPAGRGRTLSPPPVKTAALELGVPVIQPSNLRDPSAIEQLAVLRPEVIVAVAYGQILRNELLALPPKGVLNVHPSLLPRWRGATPIPAAILAGDTETGVTIMLMDEGMDTGPILAQTPAPITDHDTTATLTVSLAELGAAHLTGTLPRWLAGEITPIPQDGTVATVCRPLTSDDGVIDWSMPAVDIWRRVRAYDPWPGARSSAGGESIRIWSVVPLPASEEGLVPGTIVPMPAAAADIYPEAAFAVQTGDRLLAVLSAQRAGRKRLSSRELLRGMPGLIGSVLS
jgi:methionyl-tRNA formyltransferase